MIPTQQHISNWKKFHGLFATAFVYEALGAAVELGIADVVGISEESVGKIALKLGLNESALYRLLRALAAYGIFTEGAGRTFQHNAFSEQLREDHPYSIKGMAELWHSPPFRNAWGSFAKALRDGKPSFSHANGVPVYQYLSEHSETAALFHRGMADNSQIMADAIARGFPFGDFQNVIDLGGGNGILLTAILERHPSLSGVVFDLPDVESSANQHFAAHGLRGRAEFLAGNWFTSVPAGFDIYTVKNSLWNWTDAECRQILYNISHALSRDAQLLIVEYLVRPADAPWSTAFDLQQLNITGGRGRTKDEYATMAEDAGLRITACFSIENQQVLQCRRR